MNATKPSSSAVPSPSHLVPDELPNPESSSSVVPVLTEFQVPLIINDYCQLARDVGAQGCHLGQEDFFGDGFIRKQEMSGKDQTSRAFLHCIDH